MGMIVETAIRERLAAVSAPLTSVVVRLFAAAEATTAG
jgi:hypothetical protein